MTIFVVAYAHEFWTGYINETCGVVGPQEKNLGLGWFVDRAGHRHIWVRDAATMKGRSYGVERLIYYGQRLIEARRFREIFAEELRIAAMRCIRPKRRKRRKAARK